MSDPVDPAVIDDREADRLRGELAIAAAGIGTFDWDLVTGRLDWDARLVEIFGYDADTFDSTIDGFNDRLHPDDLDRVTLALRTAIDTGGEFAATYRVCLPAGETRWVSARGRTLRASDGTPARLLGAAYDVTDQRDAELRVTRVLEAMPAGFYSLDRDWRFTHVNAAAEKLLFRNREELLGRVIWDEFPAARDSVVEEGYRRAVATGEQVSFPAYYPPPLDGWYEIRAWPSPDGLSVYFLDITARHREEQRARQTAARLALLAEVTEQLTGTMQAHRAVAMLAQLVAPSLADWAIVTLVDDVHPGVGRGVRDAGWWHSDEKVREIVERYCQVRLPALQENAFVYRALSSGEPVIVEHDATTAIREVLQPGEAQDLISELAPESIAVLPLHGRGRTVGLLSLFNGPGRGAISPADLQTATEVAGRAGMALDNARLYSQQRALAEQLQRSFLTAPPEPDHAEIVVRYLPAAAAAAVGGDWYDAFLQPDGATMLVIGDVAGHDTAAAATMGQLRSLLRGIATSHDESGPAAVLAKLDASMALLQVDTLATAAVARFEQDMDQRERGVTRMRWSSAGHLPPVTVHPDGTVAALGTFGRAEMLLGVDPDTRRTETVVTLDRGVTVLLYTDGLIERRDSDIDDGMERLLAVLADLADLPLQELCDRVIERMVEGHPDDDVALVAVRLHPQDRPRPAEAGPRILPGPVPPEPGTW
ncbi:Serine phosphatase RsbU, regulator of sigma subunit [Blastococcus aurantiacus]|uniref:Serine phosphatase RsbU, regulator of sigma subunit n=1 Tax=Blastococcus aurantiacus TaxID=1550231 RepID=A0A1G7HJS3_9ACTN|nr:SpoIIE family protein phosphatase [Blastococcus aurantiacus]SDF00524.1 Serine phosphatase RsbU, regulator of sigma subunit [Blastococcus aurantiacus]